MLICLEYSVGINIIPDSHKNNNAEDLFENNRLEVNVNIITPI